VLYKDRAKLDHLTRVVKRLFDFDLFLDTVGVNLLLRMGTPDVRPYLVSDFDPKYDHAVAALPQVQAQGDGIKSALGLLVPLISNFYPLVLLDEPEAHLHPPQARIIGEEIGNQARDNGSQVIVSTHDKNIVQGIVESKAPVTILHLKREGDTASAEVLNPEDIAELWKDPILRYGNALDGLFHSAVIVTEADRDSRFYEAAIDAARDATAPDSPAHNLMFIGSNGKQNMAKIVGRLRKLGVCTVSCPDLDILDDSNVLRNLIEAHDGKWEDFEPNYRKATNQFKGAPVPPSVDAVKANLEDLLDNAADETLTKPLSDAITKAVALPASKWRNLKDFGTDAFKDQKQAANALLDALDELGIVTVRKGVLENFLTTADARKGPEWIPVAFAENAHTKRAAAEQAGRVTQGRWHN
jgi:AAA domain, putative AbiEii toxin, Type IV TA system